MCSRLSSAAWFGNVRVDYRIWVNRFYYSHFRLEYFLFLHWREWDIWFSWMTAPNWIIMFRWRNHLFIYPLHQHKLMKKQMKIFEEYTDYQKKIKNIQDKLNIECVILCYIKRHKFATHLIRRRENKDIGTWKRGKIKCENFKLFSTSSWIFFRNHKRSGWISFEKCIFNWVSFVVFWKFLMNLLLGLTLVVFSTST